MADALQALHDSIALDAAYLKRDIPEAVELLGLTKEFDDSIALDFAYLNDRVTEAIDALAEQAEAEVDLVLGRNTNNG
jgi:hypothetical protein